jgi:hypothetical protein
MSLFIVPLATFANHHESMDKHEGMEKRVEKTIIIKTDGDVEASAISGVLRQAESELQEGDENVFVIIDDEGNVTIEKSGSPIHGEKHRMMRMHSRGEGPHMAGMHKMHHSKPMNEETAKCIIKNLNKAHSDKATQLLQTACTALNPTEE